MKLALLAIALCLGGCLEFHSGAMPGEPKTASFATITGVRVRYVDVGSGSPVVLLHGFASSLETWDPVIPELVRHGHRVLALDLKGFGWSDRPEGDYSPLAEARLVFALMDARHIGRAALVGHSWGAGIALAAALDAPARITKLALYDAWAYEEQLPALFLWARASGVGEAIFGAFYDQRVDEKLEAAFYDPRFLTEELVEAVERAFDRPGTLAAALAAVRGQRYAEVEGRYATIDIPAILLWGREDVVSTLAVAERLSHDLPRSRLVIYPRCGHFPMIEAAARSTADLVAFLDEERP